MKVDLLTSKDGRSCSDCGDPWGVHIAVDSGILQNSLCFQCIVKYLEEIR